MDQEQYDGKMQFCSPISFPMAPFKLSSKVLKLCKKANKSKQLKRGVKEITKAVRKKVPGLVILAGDVFPIDVISHLPILCEDNNVPYVYLPSRECLANATQTNRPTSCLMVLPKPIKAADDSVDEKFQTLYNKMDEKLRKLDHIPDLEPAAV